MATINYTQTDSTTGGCANNTSLGLSQVCADGGTAGSGSVTFNESGSNLAGDLPFHISPASGTTWGSGNWTFRWNITVANMNLTWTGARVIRVSSSTCGPALETLVDNSAQSVSLGTTGIKSITLSGVSGTPSAGDRITIQYYVTNGAMTSQTMTYVPNQNIDSPFTGVTTHATSGALAGQGAVINGAAVLHKKHATTGSIIGPGSLINGSAAHVAKHATSGALVGPGALINGSAVHNAKHTTTGALTGQGSVISGAAARTRNHPTTGALTGQGALITGVAARMRQHPTVGALLGQGAIIVGSATRTSPAANTHNASGALVGQGSVIAGVAAHIAIHGTSGALVGSGASISGAASRSGASPVVVAQAMILRPRHRRRGNVSF